METTVAQNILQQLGGHKFSAMTDMDDYTMTFYKFRVHGAVKTKDIDGVYCDNLTEIFRAETGLETSL